MGVASREHSTVAVKLPPKGEGAPLMDDQAEQLVAKRLLAHLERCGWEFGHRPLGR